MAKTKNKQPVTKGVAHSPVVMQMEALECGAACLCMVLAYYDKWVPLDEMRQECGVSRDGVNAKSLVLTAGRYGLQADGYRYEPAMLRERGTYPCIIHWNFHHFVVLNGFKGNKAYLSDPTKGAYSVTMEQFDEGFTGVCLFLTPTADFVPGGRPRSVLSFAKARLKGARKAVAFTMATGVAAAVLGALNPEFSRFFLDYLLSEEHPEWLLPFLLVLGGFNLLMLGLNSLQSIYSLRIRGEFAVVGNTSYMWQVLHLPMAFFSQHVAGDIQSRQGENATIANTLINTFAPMLLNFCMTVFYLVVMLRYSLLLTAVGLFSLAINSLVSNAISRRRVNITRVSMRSAAMLQAASVAGIEMIETIKASGAENGYFSRWAGYQAEVNTQNVKYLKVNQYLGAIPQFVSSMANYTVLLLGVLLTMEGKFTVGMIMAFQSFLGSFMAPVQSFISAGQRLQEMRTQMERVEDVMERPVDNIFSQEGSTEKLTGQLELKQVTFGYNIHEQPVVKNIDLSLTPGKVVAVVGGSGCGKSTITRLLAGLYQPWTGEILYDGKKIGEIDKATFHRELAVVDQEIILFEDTIANNIKMWNDSISDESMIQAAKDAQIHKDIMQRPEGYQYRMVEGGKDFSGGQRQRMEIARALALNPSIILLDEATSTLDAKTEYEVVRAIRNRGISCIVVAHRLSTIRSADEILVLDKGVVVERGTHKELLEQGKLYARLVTSE